MNIITRYRLNLHPILVLQGLDGVRKISREEGHDVGEEIKAKQLPNKAIQRIGPKSGLPLILSLKQKITVKKIEYMDNKIITGIILFIILGLLGWFKIKGFSIFDRHKIYKWLKSNTKDEPGESHVDTITIAKGNKLPEDRVRSACMSCNKIYRYSNGKEQWSVWREQPQSCYEGLSKEEIRKRIEF